MLLRCVAVVVALWVSVTAHADEKTIDFVVDIDGVLAFVEGRELDPPVQDVLLRMGVLVVANGKVYRLAHGAGTFLQALTHISGSRVSFYSAHGRTGRTAEILGKIILPNGKSAWEIAHNILFRPSVDDMAHVADPEAFRPSQPLFRTVRGGEKEQKKDLRKVARDIDLDRAILIDDLPTNVVRGQEKNFLWCQFRNGPLELTRIRGLIDRAIHDARDRGIPIADALWELQWKETQPDVVFDRVRAHEEVMERGLKKMRKEFPAFSLDAPYVKALHTKRLEDAREAERLMRAEGSLPVFQRRKPLEGPVPPEPLPQSVLDADRLPAVVIPLPPDRMTTTPVPVLPPVPVLAAASDPRADAPQGELGDKPPKRKRRSALDRLRSCGGHLVDAVRVLFSGSPEE